MQPSRISQLLGAIRSNTRLKSIVALIILVGTVIVFATFIVQHPEYRSQLRQVHLSLVLTILTLNALLIGILATIYRVSVGLCGKQIGVRENFLLTAYSSIINFFGPLQSGPGVRAVYLKTRLQVLLRDYAFVTLIYYGVFAVINIGFLFAGSRPWWQAVLALVAGIGFSAFVIRRFGKRGRQAHQSKLTLQPRLLGLLAVFTFLQVAVLCLMYFIELHTLDASISLRQAITYTGAANLALFVSLTPGAIGFRESFLVFSQQLHHVDTGTIVTANLIDRAVYVLFLLLLTVIVFLLHAKKQLGLKTTTKTQ